MKIYIKNTEIHELEFRYKAIKIETLKKLRELMLIKTVNVVVIDSDDKERSLKIDENLSYSY